MLASCAIAGRLRRRVLGGVLVSVTAAFLLCEAAVADSPSTLDPASPEARSIEDLWWFLLIVAAVVTAVVIALVFLAVLRRRGEDEEERLRGRLGGNWLVGVGGIAVPIVILAILFGLTLGTLEDISPAESEGGLEIEVTARQWFWDVSYPEQDVVTANEIHVPVGEPVTIRLASEDVVHSFWVPELNRKVDAIPGRVNEIGFTAERTGSFRGLCAEFCGLQHANMGFFVVVEEPADFDAWVERESEPAGQPATAAARSGREVFMSEGCADCHRIAGTPADGDVGPDLTHLAARSTIASATLDNDRGSLGGWVLDPQHIKPGAKMPGTPLSGPELQDLLDYLEGLR